MVKRQFMQKKKRKSDCIKGLIQKMVDFKAILEYIVFPTLTNKGVGWVWQGW